MEEKKCLKCGSLNPNFWDFCLNCGEKLDDGGENGDPDSTEAIFEFFGVPVSPFPSKEDWDIVGARGISAWEARELGKPLARMREPSLLKLAADMNAWAYRCTMLPTFDNPVSIRIFKTRKGMKLVSRRLDGQGGYDPGWLTEEFARWLSDDEVQEIDEKLDALDFFALETKDKEGVVLIDGVVWLLEAVDGGRYHIVVGRLPDVWTWLENRVGMKDKKCPKCGSMNRFFSFYCGKCRGQLEFFLAPQLLNLGVLLSSVESGKMKEKERRRILDSCSYKLEKIAEELRTCRPRIEDKQISAGLHELESTIREALSLPTGDGASEEDTEIATYRGLHAKIAAWWKQYGKKKESLT